MTEDTTIHPPMAVGRETSGTLIIILYIPMIAARDTLRIDMLHPSANTPPFEVAQTALVAPPTHIHEERQSEGRRNVAYHTGIVKRVPQFALDTQEPHLFRGRQHKRDKGDRPSNRDAQIDLIPIDGPAPAVLAFCPSA